MLCDGACASRAARRQQAQRQAVPGADDALAPPARSLPPVSTMHHSSLDHAADHQQTTQAAPSPILSASPPSVRMHSLGAKSKIAATAPEKLGPGGIVPHTAHQDRSRVLRTSKTHLQTQISGRADVSDASSPGRIWQVRLMLCF